jgi:hypothetical protein
MGADGRGGSPLAAISSDIMQRLVEASPLYSWGDLHHDRALPPEGPGVYAWFFHVVPPGVPVAGRAKREGGTLLYVGIAPRSERSPATLRDRIRYHFRGNAEGSTLRLSLGCLLAKALGTQLRRVGTGSRMTFVAREANLTDWMARHARVAWVEVPKPWVVESQILRSLSLPLNMDQNTAHPFCAVLKALRAEARKQARALPVISP